MVRLAELPTVQAVTIHKGQSGQFDRVSVIRPGSPLLTHELLYTAITRARTHLRIIGTEEAIHTTATVPTPAPADNAAEYGNTRPPCVSHPDAANSLST